MDLTSIATEGFTALGAAAPPDVVQTLVSESFHNPQLMQFHCLRYSKAVGLMERADSTINLEPLRDWDDFFRRYADVASRPTYTLLAKSAGPRAALYRARDGGPDIPLCEAILRTVAQTGPVERVTEDDIREGMNAVLDGKPARVQDVRRALSSISESARTRVAGDLVVDYAQEDGAFHIADPFFAHYLRWVVRQT